MLNKGLLKGYLDDDELILEGSNKEKDEAAIEAGKLLVQEILYNTDDRTGLIAKC